MFRSVLLLSVVAVSAANGAVDLSLGAYCGPGANNPHIHWIAPAAALQGTFAGSCAMTNPLTGFVTSANASIAVSGWHIRTEAQSTSAALGIGASAAFGGWVYLTISGGTGLGILTPVFSTSGDSGFAAHALEFSADQVIPLPPNAPCTGLEGCSAFQFGVPRGYSYFLFSRAQTGTSVPNVATFTGQFEIWDAQGNRIPDAIVDFYDWPQPNAYNYPGMIPEPSASWLVALGLTALAAGHWRHRHSR